MLFILFTLSCLNLILFFNLALYRARAVSQKPVMLSLVPGTN